MATQRVISREEFVVAAVEHGDLQTAQQYFAQEEVIAEVERVNAFFVGLETPITSLDSGPEDPWYFTQPPGQFFRQVGPRSLIFYTAMEKDNVVLIQWLFAPAQAAFMGVTLAALFPIVVEIAADANHVEILELLLVSDIFTTTLTADERQICLDRMLGIAVERSHEDVVMMLLAHGAQVTPPPQPQPEREDLLSLCASSGTARCVEVLVANGITTVGADVLYHASLTNNLESARQLLKHGVDWGNEANTTTPLHIAAEECYSELVLLLLRQGFADVDIPDSDRATAIELASRRVGFYGHVYNGSQGRRDPVLTLRRYGAKMK